MGDATLGRILGHTKGKRPLVGPSRVSNKVLVLGSSDQHFSVKVSAVVPGTSTVKNHERFSARNFHGELLGFLAG